MITLITIILLMTLIINVVTYKLCKTEPKIKFHLFSKVNGENFMGFRVVLNVVTFAITVTVLGLVCIYYFP